jgi:pyruvate dehydrogenase E1 component
MLTNLLKDAALGPRVVPIVADEARTFGMANLFKQVGIYSSAGQTYEPEDIGSLMSYREATDGQILEEGISEAGAISSWTAAATSYSAHGQPMLPFYIYYSMFGFQRVGDLIWAAADQRSRGFLLGATAGRTTLGGEGLQHQDGSSLLQASAVPNCRAYDPCFAGEFAVILDHGMREMLEQQRDVFYYVTLMNENYAQPSLPAGAEVDVVKGLYRLSTTRAQNSRGAVRLLGSGAVLREVIAAAVLLADDWQIDSEVWSATSFSELERDARETARWNRLHPTHGARTSHLQRCLPGATPIVAASDSVCGWPQLVAGHVDAPFSALGTDGFGRSDTRTALRRFFEVDRHHVALAALDALRRVGTVDAALCAEAIARYGIDAARAAPWLS